MFSCSLNPLATENLLTDSNQQPLVLTSNPSRHSGRVLGICSTLVPPCAVPCVRTDKKGARFSDLPSPTKIDRDTTSTATYVACSRRPNLRTQSQRECTTRKATGDKTGQPRHHPASHPARAQRPHLCPCRKVDAIPYANSKNKY